MRTSSNPLIHSLMTIANLFVNIQKFGEGYLQADMIPWNRETLLIFLESEWGWHLAITNMHTWSGRYWDGTRHQNIKNVNHTGQVKEMGCQPWIVSVSLWLDFLIEKTYKTSRLLCFARKRKLSLTRCSHDRQREDARQLRLRNLIWPLRTRSRASSYGRQSCANARLHQRALQPEACAGLHPRSRKIWIKN